SPIHPPPGGQAQGFSPGSLHSCLTALAPPYLPQKTNPTKAPATLRQRGYVTKCDLPQTKKTNPPPPSSPKRPLHFPFPIFHLPFSPMNLRILIILTLSLFPQTLFAQAAVR